MQKHRSVSDIRGRIYNSIAGGIIVQFIIQLMSYHMKRKRKQNNI
jgi:hypothetical protein